MVPGNRRSWRLEGVSAWPFSGLDDATLSNSLLKVKVKGEWCLHSEGGGP